MWASATMIVARWFPATPTANTSSVSSLVWEHMNWLLWTGHNASNSETCSGTYRLFVRERHCEVPGQDWMDASMTFASEAIAPVNGRKQIASGCLIKIRRVTGCCLSGYLRLLVSAVTWPPCWLDRQQCSTTWLGCLYIIRRIYEGSAREVVFRLIRVTSNCRFHSLGPVCDIYVARECRRRDHDLWISNCRNIHTVTK